MRLGSWLRTHSDLAVLLFIILLVGGANLLWSSATANRVTNQSQETVKTAIAVNNHYWCSSLDVLLSGAKPTPAQPQSYKLFQNFKQLETKFGCDASGNP